MYVRENVHAFLMATWVRLDECQALMILGYLEKIRRKGALMLVCVCACVCVCVGKIGCVESVSGCV